MDENKNSTWNRFPDPEMELTDAYTGSLSPEKRKELIDDRTLDSVLKKNLSVSKKSASAKDFENRLKASLSGAAQNLTVDPASDGMRSSAVKLRERFVYSERSYLSWSSAAAALLAVLFLPAVLSDNIRSRTETPASASVSNESASDDRADNRSSRSDRSGVVPPSEAPKEAEKKERRVISPSGADEMMVSSRSFSMDMMEESVSEKSVNDQNFELSTAPGAQDAVLLDMLRRTASPKERLDILRKLEQMYGDMGLATRKENITEEIRQILKENPGLK